MPLLEDNVLDDVPVFDASPSFSGGQLSNSRANLLNPDQSTELTNCDITISGQLVTRRGTAPIGTNTIGAGTYIQGLCYFDTPSFQYLIAANDAHLYKLSGNTWSFIGYAASSTLVDIIMVQGINRIYIADGVLGIWAWDGTVFIPLGSSTNSQPPAAPKTLAWHTSRLIAAGMIAEPDAIYFSGILAGSTWDKTNWQIRVGGGDSDLITGILPWTNFNLLVFKKRSVWVVNCNPTLAISEFPINAIHRAIGCLAPKTAVQVGSDVFFLSDSGVRSVQRTLASENQNQVGEALSYPIQDVIERINHAAINTACASYWNNRYILSVPLDASNVPNAILVYNNLTQAWSGTWTGLEATVFAIRGVPADNPRLAIGIANGKVSDWLDYIPVASEIDTSFQDSGVDIPTSILTRAFTFREPACPKTGFNVELEFNGSASQITAEAILDDGTPVELQESPLMTGSGGLTLPLTLPFTLPTIGVVRKATDLQSYGQFRELQLRLTSTSGKLALRNIAVSAFVDSIVLQA